jgi:hypothetical protein
MDKKTTGLIATGVAVVLCGCPGLFGICFGAFFAVISQIPGSNIDIFGSSDPQSALIFGIIALVLGFLLVIVPILVGIFTLRRKTVPDRGAALPPFQQPPDEPIPPAI